MLELDYKPGDILSKTFQITAFLGTGAFSRVYQANNLTRKGRVCVLKLIKPKDPKVRSSKLFDQECQVLEKLDHPRIAKLFSYGRLENGIYYIELEHIEGPTIQKLLDDAVEQGIVPPFPVRDVREIALELLEALTYLHTHPQDILHRDVKPGNLIRNPERGLVIIDFNVSKIVIPKKPPMTQVGTSGYMPPEVRFLNQPWTCRSDLYSTGIVLYQMLTGQLPFDARSVDEVPHDPQKLYPDLPYSVGEIVLKAIRYNPDERYSDAPAMRDAIESNWPLDLMPQVSLNDERNEHKAEREDRETQMLNQYLVKAKKLASQDRFSEALAELREARKLPSMGAEEREQIKAVEQEVERIRWERVQTLTDKLTPWLEKRPEQLTREDLGEVEKALATLQDMHPHPTELESLTGRWQRKRDRAIVLLDLEETRRELDELWKASFIQIRQYDKARELAQQIARAYPNEALAQELLSEAQERREEAYKKKEILTTHAETHGCDALLEELKRLEGIGYDELPWYELGEKEIDGKVQRILLDKDNYVPARQAIEQVERLRNAMHDARAADYKQRAMSEMPADPGAAEGWIKKALEDFLQMSDAKRIELERFRKEIIEPAQEKRKQALERIIDAQKPHREILQAWSLLDQAEEIDRHPRELALARDTLRPHLQSHLENELRQAEDKQQQGEFESADRQAKEVLKIAQKDGPLSVLAQDAQALIEQCRLDKEFFERLQRDAARVSELVNSDLGAATQELAKLEERVANRPEPFQKILEDARRAVQAQQTLEELLKDWVRRFLDLNPDRLEIDAAEPTEPLLRTLSQLERLEQEVGQAKIKHSQPAKILDFEERLKARWHFVQGRLDWETGLYQRAKNAWARVVESNRDDATSARVWLRMANDATAVSEAIVLATDLIAPEREGSELEGERYQSALGALREWTTKSSPRQTEVRKLYRRIEGELADQLEKKIEAIIANLEQYPDYQLLVDTVKQLEPLRPEKAREYKYGHFADIYEKWGDSKKRRDQLYEAAADYQYALGFCAGDKCLQIEHKYYFTCREQVFKQTEEFLREDNQSRDDRRQEEDLPSLGDQDLQEEFLEDDWRRKARQELASWISGQARYDLPGLIWLINLLLEDGDIRQAKSYFRQAERGLDAAARAEDPIRAGLEQIEEIAEGRLKLEALGYKVKAIECINQAKQRVRERLNPDTRLRGYRSAQEARDGLVEQLGKIRQDMRQQQEHFNFESLSRQAQARLRQNWQKTQRWLDEQIDPGVQSWYTDLELEVLDRLRVMWEQTNAFDAEDAGFRVVSPSTDLKKRWEVGLKIRFIFRPDPQGEQALHEIDSARRRLERVADELANDQTGPEYDLQGKKLEPFKALERQLAWSDHLMDWAECLEKMLQDYTRATEHTAESGTGKDTPKSDQEPQSYQDARSVLNTIDQAAKALLGLKTAVQHTKTHLDQAKTAGREGHRRWEHVSWAQLTTCVLSALKTSLPLGQEEQDSDPDYWKNLQDDDRKVRWSAWQKAAEALTQAKLTDRPEKALWQEINQKIRRAGIEEDWDQVGALLQQHQQGFGQHRAFKWILAERAQAEATRNELVLTTILLYSLVQAEKFHAALEQMKRMEKLDPYNDYGFCVGSLINAPEPMQWDKLKEWLENCQRQWDEFEASRSIIENSALRPWCEEMRAEFIRLVHRAETGPAPDEPQKTVLFGAAEALGRDALDGMQADGYTNQLGGGLALGSLLKHLNSLPPSLDQVRGHRLRQALIQVRDWQHDTQEAVDELSFWLTGKEGKHRPAEIPNPIKVVRQNFLDAKEALDAAMHVLRSIDVRGLKRIFKEREKEDQRQYCQDLLQELREIAPEWPELTEYEQEIKEV